MGNRIVFMGSDPIALPMLEAIIRGRCGAARFVSIYTQPDRPRGRGKKVVANGIKEWALDNGIAVLQPEKLTKADRLEIEAMGADAVIVMAYGHMLSQKLIDTPRCGIWNLHTSLLPKYRGASPIQCSIASGDSETGVSLMRMEREMDAGPVLDVEKVPIGDLDTALDVERSLSAACVPLMSRNLARIFENDARCAPQDSVAATYVRKLGKEDGTLDFRVSARALARRANGLFPWPGTQFRIGDEAIKVGLADAVDIDAVAAPGVVLHSDRQGLVVACGEGAIRLRRLQRSGSKMMEAADFLRGYAIADGTILESKGISNLVETKRPAS